MKKTLVLSTLLAVAALGIACGPAETPKTNSNAAPANTAKPATNDAKPAANDAKPANAK